MQHWKRRRGRQRLWQFLTVAGLMSLQACDSMNTINGCPSPIFPDKCAVDWIATSDTPQCFVGYIDKLDRQQCLLQGRKDCS
jgi:hypothetical protein